MEVPIKTELNSDAALAPQLTKAADQVDIHTFAGGLPQEKGTIPQIRLGSRWFSTAQVLTVLVPVGFVGLLVLIATAQQLRMMPGVQAFIAQYPGTGSFATPVEDGFPWWLRSTFPGNFADFKLKVGGLVEHPPGMAQGRRRLGGKGGDKWTIKLALK